MDSIESDDLVGADVIMIIVVVGSRLGIVLFFSRLADHTCPTWAAFRAMI